MKNHGSIEEYDILVGEISSFLKFIIELRSKSEKARKFFLLFSFARKDKYRSYIDETDITGATNRQGFFNFSRMTMPIGKDCWSIYEDSYMSGHPDLNFGIHLRHKYKLFKFERIYEIHKTIFEERHRAKFDTKAIFGTILLLANILLGLIPKEAITMVVSYEIYSIIIMSLLVLLVCYSTMIMLPVFIGNLRQKRKDQFVLHILKICSIDSIEVDSNKSIQPTAKVSAD